MDLTMEDEKYIQPTSEKVLWRVIVKMIMNRWIALITAKMY